MGFWWANGASQREVYLAVWGICSKINGEWMGPEEVSPRTTAFASVKHALREIVINRADGYSLPNTSDPGRLAAHAGGLVGGGHSGDPSDSRVARRAQDLAIVAKAFESAFEGVTDVETRRIYEFLLLARYVADKSPADLADRVAEHGIIPSDVITITREGWIRIAAVLESHGLVPSRLDRQTASHADLVGWKDIAKALRVSVRTAQRYAEGAGLPVRHVKIGASYSRAEASSSEIREWKAQRTTPR